MDNLRERVEALEHYTHGIERQMRWWRAIACSVLVVGLVSLPISPGTAKNDQPTAAEYHGWKQRLAALEYKLQYVTGGVNEVVITGANLRIVNGLGRTDCGTSENPIPGCPNGLGNLIVGYNEARPDGTTVQTGSHNVVVGQFNNFSSFGGLVVGFDNEVSDRFASVSGGTRNTASGPGSSVSGGASNTASGRASSVSGGEQNKASFDFASVSGGEFNTASLNGSSVSGGSGNTASGPFASVSGGSGNTASGDFSSVSGGASNTASDSRASVSGGLSNTASNDFASVSGGANNTASGPQSSVSGGHNRTAPAQLSWAAAFFFADDF